MRYIIGGAHLKQSRDSFQRQRGFRPQSPGDLGLIRISLRPSRKAFLSYPAGNQFLPHVPRGKCLIRFLPRPGGMLLFSRRFHLFKQSLQKILRSQSPAPSQRVRFLRSIRFVKAPRLHDPLEPASSSCIIPADPIFPEQTVCSQPACSSSRSLDVFSVAAPAPLRHRLFGNEQSRPNGIQVDVIAGGLNTYRRPLLLFGW